MDNVVFRQGFGSLIQDLESQDFKNGDYGILHLKGCYRVLNDGNFVAEFCAETIQEAIQKFHDCFKK